MQCVPKHAESMPDSLFLKDNLYTVKLYNAVSRGPKCMPLGAIWALQLTRNNVITVIFYVVRLVFILYRCILK